MDNNPYEPPKTPFNGEHDPQSPHSGERTLTDPVLAYTASGNLEAHSVVTWLESHGLSAYAVEDNSGVSTYMFGTISQFHKPQVFVEREDSEKAGSLLQQFDSQRRERRAGSEDVRPITAVCEECGEPSEFPAAQDGTTQNCPKCHAYMDVGTLDWPEDCDFGDEEPEPEIVECVDDAIDAAYQLDKAGDWNAAIDAFRLVATRWPDVATYAENCIAEIQQKLDATK